MRRQAGFTLYVILGLLLALSATLLLLKAQSYRLELSEAKYDRFVSDTETVGLAAAKEAKRKNDENRVKKEKSDAETKKLLADNAALARSLRDERARRGVLSGVSSPANRPNLVCFGRAEYERAFGQFDKELSGIAQECDERTVNLNSARKWLLDVVK